MRAVAILAVGLAACAPQPDPATVEGAAAIDNVSDAMPAGSGCDAAAVQDLIGRPRSDAVAADAQRRSGAKVVRWLTPDMAVTMEYRADRLNLHLGSDGRIGSARCG